MANFQSALGKRISCQNIVATSAVAEIGLYGYKDFNQQDLNVVAMDPNIPGKRLAGITAAPGMVRGDVRMWSVTSTIGGQVRLEAQARDGSTWDWMLCTFTGAPGSPGSDADKEAVLAAITEGRILGETSPIKTVCTKGFMDTKDGPITLSAGMFATLAALAEDDTLRLMSTMWYGHGPHGKIQADGSAICCAMDIMQFGRFPINLINGQGVDNTIKGIASVLSALPPGSYAVGLTRPSPYDKGPPMPEKDVFLPMKTSADMYKPGFPLSNPTAQFVNADAREAINFALMHNTAAKMNRMFQDGPTHMHLEVIEAKR